MSVMRMQIGYWLQLVRSSMFHCLLPVVNEKWLIEATPSSDGTLHGEDVISSPVRAGQHYNISAGVEAVHLYEQLIQGALALQAANLRKI